LGKAEDAAHASGNTGVMALAVRNDAGTALATTDLDYIPLGTDATGNLRVGGATATALGKAEDALHASGDVGVPAWAVRNDSGAALAGSGDYIPLTTDGSGLLRVTICSPDGDPQKRQTQFLETDSFSDDADAAPGLALVTRQSPIVGSSAVDETLFASCDPQGYMLVRTRGDVMTTIPFSASTRGRPVQITATASAGTTIHTATTTAGEIDKIYLSLCNTSASAVTVTIEFGTTGVGNEIDIIVPANEEVVALDGVVIGGAATDTVAAYASTGSVVNAIGRVERLTA